MTRFIHYFVALILVVAPVQTHWLISQPRILGSVWEFGCARLLVMECFVLLICLFVVPAWWRSRSQKDRAAVVVGIVGLFVWGVLIPSGELVALLQSVHLLSALALGIVLYEAVKRYGVVWVLRWYLLGGVLWAGLGVTQWIMQSVSASTLLGMAAHAPSVAGDAVIQVRGVRMLRVYGAMPHPNIFGALMVSYMYAAILLLRALPSRVRAQRIIGIGALTLSAVALLLSFSRSAWIAGAIAFAVAVPWRAWRVWAWTLAVPALCIACVGFYMSADISSRLQTTTSIESQSRTERVESVQSGLQLFTAQPIWGTGLGLATAALHASDPSRAGWQLQPPHLTPVLILLELGIVGVLLLVFCLYALPWNWGIMVLTPGLLFDHFYWSLPAGIFVLTALWILTTIQAQLALRSTEC